MNSEPKSGDSPWASPEARTGKQVSPGGVLAIVVVAVCALSLLLNLSGSLRSKPGKHPAVGKKFFRYQLRPLAGAEQPLASGDLDGKVTLINNWGPWCGPCRAEFPELLQLLGRYESNDEFQFVSISWSNGDSLAQHQFDTKQFLETFQASIPVYLDVDGTFRNSFQFAAGEMVFPSTVVLDREGVIRGLWMGYEPGITDEMSQLLGELLAEKN